MTITCTIHLPSWQGWFYILAVHGSLVVGLGIPWGIFLYQLSPSWRKRGGLTVAIVSAVVVHQGMPWLLEEQQQQQAEEEDTTKLPVAYYCPWMALVLASTFGFVTCFKSVAVAYEQYPEGVMTTSSSNLVTFLLWFLCFPEPIFVKGKMKRATRQELRDRMVCCLGKMVGLFVVVSLLLDVNQSLLRKSSSSTTTTTITTLGWQRWWWFPMRMMMLPPRGNNNNNNGDGGDELPTSSYWWWSHMIRGYLHICFIYLFVSFCLDLNTLAIGYPTSRINNVLRNKIGGGGGGGGASSRTTSSSSSFYSGFQSPLWSSRSIKELWGTRWNTPVQTLLQRSVYIPARQAGWSRGAAVGWTFFVSGLLHEYTFSIHNASAYHRPGEVTVFFLLMSLVMIMEDSIWNVVATVTNGTQPRAPIVVLRRFVAGIPSPILSTLLAMMAGFFVAPLFSRTWIEAGAIESVAALLPHWVCQEQD
jgi:hypothetical protein